MRKNFTQTILLSLFMLGLSTVRAQYSPTHSTAIDVTENTGLTLNNYQVKLIVDTETLVNAGNMQADGRDIRFSGQNCSSGSFYDYWIEEAMNTDTTVIWVLMPTLPASSTETIYMMYGDPSATPASSFNATFPNAVITAGTSTTLTGVSDIGWLEVNAGDTLYTGAGSVLALRARYAKVDGVLYAEGAGYQAPLTGPAAGTGPGGGQAGSSSGAGGGAYGGDGGIGGYDSGDPINAGGTAYGTLGTPVIDMGSSGGTTSSVTGGNGGGAISLVADYIEINGEVNVDGNDGQMPGGGQGGGGGAGGGLLLIADTLIFTGSATANGGGGSIGTSTANDDGGGGGGGRIKFFHDTYFSNTGTQTALGGPGGVNGGTGTGAPGSAGTVYDQTVTFITESYVTGTSNTLPSGAPVPDVATLDADTSYCVANPAPPTATDICGNTVFGTPDVTIPITAIGTTTVTWTYTSNSTTATQTQDIVVVDTVAPVLDSTALMDVSGDCAVTIAAPTATDACQGAVTGVADVTFPVTANGTTVITWTFDDGNGNVVTQTQNAIVNNVDNTISQAGATLTANEAGATYQWLDCDNGFAPIAGETGQSFTATAVGNYAVEIVGNTCTDTSACFLIDFSGISETDNKLGLEVFPNPSNNFIQIKGLNNAKGVVSAQITSLQGDVVLNLNGKQQTIDVSTLAEGVYFYRLYHDEGIETIKFVKH